MITNEVTISAFGVEFSFKGLSTDTKPVETYKGSPIANGSTFMEIDTKKLYFYDADGKQWV